MERGEITRLLKESHSSFVNYIRGLTNDEFLFSHPQKWTAGQQLEHIYLSVRPVVLALGLPKLLVRIVFGVANRPSRTYDDLVGKYLKTLENGGKSSRPFIPKAVAVNQKESIIAGLNKKVDALCSRTESFTEKELDALILPHPLLGKLTMREMLYFTIYHVGHHHQAIKRSLKHT